MVYFDKGLTIASILDYGVSSYPTREIVYRDLRRYTFSSFRDHVLRTASALKRLGVRRGDRVAVVDWDTDVYLSMYYAVPLLGAVLHTVNVRYPPELMLKTVIRAEDRFAVVRDEFLPLVEKGKEFLKGLKVVAYSDSREPVRGYTDLWQEVESSEVSPLDPVGENQDATIFFTSGTTGEPKAVSFTHRQLVLHALAVTAVTSSPPISSTSDDVMMVMVPMFHVHSWGFPHYFLLRGAKYVLPGRYDPVKALEFIRREGVNFSAMVPSILVMLLDASERAGVPLKGLRVMIGGSALPEGLARRAREAGVVTVGGYGLSETCPVLTLGYHTNVIRDLGDEDKFREQITAGFPLPLVELKVVDDEMRELQRGKIGEVVVRAPWLTREYVGDPERTEALWRGGWLHTGDLGYLDEYGYLRIVDREKDAIKSGGEFIPSLLLENAISYHPAVSEVAVVGKKDEKWGERPVAFVVRRKEVTEGELRDFLMGLVNEGKIQKWWIPDRFIFVDNLPRTSTNKVDKKALRGLV